MKQRHLKSFNQLIADINLQDFTVDWCSDNGLDFDELSKKYFASITNLKKYAGLHKLKRSPIFIKNKREKTNIERYGFSSAASSSIIKDKIKETNLERYGVENPSQSEKIREKTKQTNIERYGTDCVFQNKEVQDKIRQTNIKKYGTENPFGNDEIKHKIKETVITKYGVANVGESKEIQDKIKQTNLDRYGFEYSILNEDIKNKVKLTNLKKYGVENPFGNAEVQNKIKSTNIARYGVENPSQSEKIREKTKQTNIERYGVSCSLQNDEIHEKVKNTFNEKYGVDYYCLIAQQYTHGPKSKPNRFFEQKLKSNDINFEREFRIGNYLYDFKVGKFLIEIDPSYTHNVNYGFHNSKPIDKNYHLNKSKIAEDAGYSCIHIFDWDDVDKILNLIQPRTQIHARKTELREITPREANIFIVRNHLQGRCRGQKIFLGLFYYNELVEVMTFGEPRYNKNYEYELIRLCTKTGKTVIGGAQKLFKYFIKKYNPSSIISYCDASKFSGKIYNMLGFNLQTDKVEPSCNWYNNKTKKRITDNLLRQKGFDNLFHTSYGKGASNEELMLCNGFIQIYDCGQKTWIFTK